MLVLKRSVIVELPLEITLVPEPVAIKAATVPGEYGFRLDHVDRI
jgi:hypothetical protein